jgi:hypothetical protein
VLEGKESNMTAKKITNQSFTALAAALLGAGTLIGSSAQAQVPADAWQYRASIYAFLPSIGGTTSFPATGGSSVGVDASDIIDSLQFTFMGSFEAQKGTWGMFTDLLYVDLSASKAGSRSLTLGGAQVPAGVTANTTLDMKGLVWTLAGNYRALATPEANLDVFGGARLLNIKQSLKWALSADVGPFAGPGRQGSSEVRPENWDAIVGVKGRVQLGAGGQWFLPYYLDIGTGNSDLTWQAQAGVGYSFKWGEVVAGWRYLDYDFDSKAVQSLNFSGAQIGVAWRW